MSIFFNPLPQFENQNGVPYAGGNLYFGDPNVDPTQNPKTVYLDEANTIPASNPQPLNALGQPEQGTLYLVNGQKYSFLLEDSQGNQIANVPEIIGVQQPADPTEVPPVIIQDSLTVTGEDDATIIINSGVSPGDEGTLDYQENGVSVWQWVREAIIDGGNLFLSNVLQGSVKDIEFFSSGGWAGRFLGADRIVLDNDGMQLKGELKNNKQVLAASGTFTAAGVAVGQTFGITSAGPVAGSPTGEYEVVLDFFPSDEADLSAQSDAENGGSDMITRATGGPTGFGTVLVFTSNGGTGARENCTSFSVQVFDLGRS